MVSEIQRRYGDHLYGKHDYDAAMTQYLATIGHLEASFVIRKFLDAQRIHNLTSYLEALHAQACICFHQYRLIDQPSFLLYFNSVLHCGCQLAPKHNDASATRLHCCYSLFQSSKIMMNN